MPRRIIDMMGFKAGFLTVIAYAGQDKRRHATWICECVCGKRTEPIDGRKLRYGERKSCGCLQHAYRPSMAPKAGMGVHRFIRRIWDEMALQQITQEEIAKRATISVQAMRAVRDGRTRAKLADVEAMLNVLGYDLVLRARQ